MTTAQVIITGLGILNGYLLFALTRLLNWQKEMEKRVGCLEAGQITEEKFRKIMNDELQKFELRLIKTGQLGS